MMQELVHMLNSLKYKNPYEIFTEYKRFFEDKKQLLHITKIRKGRVFYRARKGINNIPGSIDDLDIDVQIPYFNTSLEAPPSISSSGGRFNRQGYSFLYIASDIKTCVAEIKLEVNQICSVGKFRCINAGKYVDLVNYDNELMKSLSMILLQPIHSEINEKYLITQFVADIFREMGYKGIVYPSTQTKGINVVSFYPSDFLFVPYSEKAIITRKISYSIEEVEDSYKRYFDYQNLLNSYNEKEAEEKEEIFNYIDEKIQHEIDIDISKMVKIAEEQLSYEEKHKAYNKLVDKYFLKNTKVNFFRGNFYLSYKLYDEAIKDYFSIRLTNNDINKLVNKIKTTLTEDELVEFKKELNSFIKENKLENTKKVQDIYNKINKI